MLCNKDLTSLLGNVLPVHRIKIMAFLVVPFLLLFPSLIFLDIQLRLLPNSRLIGVRADDFILAINQLQPWVRPATPKALGFAGCALGFKAHLSGIIAITLESLLGHACMSMALGEMKLLASALLHPNNVADISEVVLHFDEGIQHVNKDRLLSEGCLCAGLPIEREVGAEAFLKRWVNVILKNSCQVAEIFLEVVDSVLVFVSN